MSLNWVILKLESLGDWLYIGTYLHFPEEEISFDEFVSNTSIVVFHILPAVLPLKIEESTSKDCLVDFDIADAIHNSRVDAAWLRAVLNALAAPLTFTNGKLIGTGKLFCPSIFLAEGEGICSSLWKLGRYIISTTNIGI